MATESIFTLVWTTTFVRTAKKFLKKHPELGPQVASVLRDLETDPFLPQLRFHQLTGKLKGLQAVSVTHSYRITLTLVINEKEITLLDIGSHDEVYR